VRQALSRQIRAGRAFVLILGASGNGKSSLARAGLLSRLTGPWVAEEAVTTGFCRHAIVRPGDGASPLEALAQALAREGALPDLAAQGKASALARAWSKSPEAAVNDVRGALAREAQRTAGGEDPVSTGRLVLLVDQLEEVFRHRAWEMRVRPSRVGTKRSSSPSRSRRSRKRFTSGSGPSRREMSPREATGTEC
jgi:energy-coupling factor transporter ATP-binding protein EcfA2